MVSRRLQILYRITKDPIQYLVFAKSGLLPFPSKLSNDHLHVCNKCHEIEKHERESIVDYCILEPDYTEDFVLVKFSIGRILRLDEIALEYISKEHLFLLRE